jgi:hypothetical protein
LHHVLRGHVRMDKQGYEWLDQEYPGLTIGEDGVSGHIEFTGAYDEQTGLFTIIRQKNLRQERGKVLSGSFEVLIQGSIDPLARELPYLYVKGVNHTADRHFNQTDSSACVCSPLEADEFLNPEFDFQKFLDQLVIPFLYGQLFFDRHGRWPWQDYAHGATGLLEAYFRNNDSNKLAECVRALSQEWSWPRIKDVLLNNKEPKGHIHCFCSKADYIRRCHPDAWYGLMNLCRDVRSTQINLP